MVKKFLFIVIILFLPFAGFAQRAETGFLAAPGQRGDFWVCPGLETAFYSSSGISAGGSFAAAYGSKVSIGFNLTWFFDSGNELDTLVLNFLLRYYFSGDASATKDADAEKGAPSAGPYLQLTGGPALFFESGENVSLPAKWGRISAGAAFGWRFLFGKVFFAEPYIRAGYPYIFGTGVSAGVHF